jgi:predicted transcriptional regulator
VTDTQSRDQQVLATFVDAIDTMGGIRNLVQQRLLGWMPDVMASADVLVLQELEHCPPDEIAALLDVSGQSVANMLAAPADEAMDLVMAPPPSALDQRETAAGALARLAYETGRRERTARGT